ncbi:hypothetical protein ACRAQ7_05975 [Erythrobacter sp. W53]|uniref:hypothetical protein n=1 Tax=Erythrobacter sp. W53 TaxID=3425947 RepID=UPI003D768C34
MEIPPTLLQFGGSLIAIVLLAGLAWKLGLGQSPRLITKDDARRAADEVVSGFIAKEIALDREGRGALVKDAAGRIIALRQHGSHFAGRELSADASARIKDGALHIATGEQRFGDISLIIVNEAAWADAIEALRTSTDA